MILRRFLMRRILLCGEISYDEISLGVFSGIALIITIVVGGLLTSWGDRVGRKVVMSVPIIGMIIGGIMQALVMLYRWPVSGLFVAAAVNGLTGYYMTMLIQGNAYLSDVTPNEGRGKRYTILETILGAAGGFAGLGGGYWINSQGFIPISWGAVVLSFIALCILPFLPNPGKESFDGVNPGTRDLTQDRYTSHTNAHPNVYETRDSGKEGFDEVTPATRGMIKHRYTTHAKEHDIYSNEYAQENNENQTESTLLLSGRNNSSKESKFRQKYKFLDLIKSALRVYSSEYLSCDECFGPDPNIDRIPSDYRCKHGGGIIRGKVWRIWLYLLSYFLYMFVNVGVFLFQSMFFLSYPLCFTPLLLGAQLAIRFTSVCAAPLVVYLFQRLLNLSNQTIILVGLLGFFMFPFTMSIATETWIVFLATSAMIVGSIAKPFIQAQISSLASQSEQGAAFAMLSSFEVLSFLLATICYLEMYPATQYISHWFTWIFSSIITAVPILLMSIVWVADKKTNRNRTNNQDDGTS
ncbi:proton-coupled folate transporter-like isoform X2 [Styela clava]